MTSSYIAEQLWYDGLESTFGAPGSQSLEKRQFYNLINQCVAKTIMKCAFLRQAILWMHFVNVIRIDMILIGLRQKQLYFRNDLVFFD